MHTVALQAASTAETEVAFAHCHIEVASKIESGLLDRLGGDHCCGLVVSAFCSVYTASLHGLKIVFSEHEITIYSHGFFFPLNSDRASCSHF